MLSFSRPVSLTSARELGQDQSVSQDVCRDIRVAGLLSGGIPLDPDFSLRDIDSPDPPDLDRVDPGVLRGGGR